MKLEMVCIQLCQGGISAWCTDKSCIVGSVLYHVVVVAFQKRAAYISVVVQDQHGLIMGLLIVSSKECVISRGLIVVRLM